MTKKIVLFLILILCLMGTSCGNATQEKPIAEPQLAQVRSICELAVIECYYHNVAKYSEEDAEGILWWKKDKRFWIEYDVVVKYGIDVSLVKLDVTDTQITITLPEAEVQECNVISSSLTEDSYIVDSNSAKITAEDETIAFTEAQKQLEESAANNKALLSEAQRRAQILLTDYVTNLGNATGKHYSIQWIYTDKNGNPLQTPNVEPLSETTEDTTQEVFVGEEY